MFKELAHQSLPVLCVPVGLAVILVPFSLLIGWNLLSAVIFWLVLTPVLAGHLPTLISNNKNLLAESLTGLLIFYALMVFMIYDHFKTDLFLIMMVSCLVNLGSVTIIYKLKREFRKPSY